MAKSRKFSDYVAEVEEQSTPEARERLELYRGHFDVARQIIELRRERGVSQTQLADMSGVHQSEISRIERGAANPTEDTLLKLLRPLGGALAVIDEKGHPIGSQEHELVASASPA
jgi:ribosome-binding protein aMBF1 (putative translation factor)